MHTWLKTIISLSLSSPPLLFSVSSLSLNASIIHGISRLYPHRRTNLHPEEHLWLTVNCSFPSSSLWYGIGMMTIMRTTSRWNKKSIIKAVVVEMLKMIIMMMIMIMYLMIFDGEKENKKKKPSLIRRYKIAILLHYLATVR
jgi:hypothetical protein